MRFNYKTVVCRKTRWEEERERKNGLGGRIGVGPRGASGEERKKQAIARLGTAGQDSHHKANQAFFFFFNPVC